MNETKPSTALATQKRTVADLINSEKTRAEIAKVLPKHLTPERMARVALTATMKNPALLECTPASLLNALLVCSQAGLEPDGRLAHLIPFKDTVQVIFDYKGLVTLALRNGAETVFADKVCEFDAFEAYVEGGQKKLNHRPPWGKNRGTPICYYAVCQRAGQVDWEVMTLEEVDAIRARSRAAKAGPWVTDYDEMAKKTVLRRMSKRWDLLPEIRDIINADHDTPQPFGVVPLARPIFDEKPAGRQIENGTPNGAPSPIAPEAPASERKAASDAPEAAPGHPTVRQALGPPAESDNGDLGPQRANLPAEREPLTPAEKPAFNALRSLRALCRMGKVNEGAVLDYVATAGATDGSVGSLEELVTAYEPVAKMLCDDWSNVVAMIRAAATKRSAQ